MSTELPTNPQNRNEQFLNAIADSSAELPANPQNRREKYLNAIAQKDASLAPAHAYNREEQYLAYIAEHPGSGGETETKTVTITENGTTEVTPTAGKTMTKVTVTTNVPTVELLAHTVTFYEADGVTKYAIISVKDGESVQVPTVPTTALENYFFIGWYTQTSGQGNRVTFPYTPTEDVSFYAFFDVLVGTSWVVNKNLPRGLGIITNLNFNLTNSSGAITPSDAEFSSIGFGYGYAVSEDPSYMQSADNIVAVISSNIFSYSGTSAKSKKVSGTPSGVSGYILAFGTSQTGRVITITILGGSSATSLTAYDLLHQTCTKVQ